MTGHRAASRYAKAVIELAEDKKSVEKVQKDMVLIRKTLKENANLQDVLFNPIIPQSKKKSILGKVFPKMSPVTKGLIDLLISNKRIELLGAVAEKFIISYEVMKGKETVAVTTAIPMNKELEKKVLKRLKKITDAKVTLENKVDESILGGFILRLGDLQYNGSVAHQLKELKRTLVNN